MSHSSQLGRLHGNAVKQALLDFDAVFDLPTKEAKRKQMARRCQEIYASAAARERATKNEVYSDPDHHAQVKCIELVSRLMNLFVADVSDQDESERREIGLEHLAGLMREAGYRVEKAA